MVYRPVADILEVNQSAFERRMVRGMKCSSTCRSDSSPQILLRDSTACRILETSYLHIRNSSYLIPYKGLLDGGEILQGWEEHVAMFRASNILVEVSQLFG